MLEVEPYKISNTVKDLGLEHVVITSVDRDDLDDGGAQHYVNVIKYSIYHIMLFTNYQYLKTFPVYKVLILHSPIFL